MAFTKIAAAGIGSTGIVTLQNVVVTGSVVSGVSTFTAAVLVGTVSSTGTASQPLQVSGGAYFSGALGIGTTNPAEQIHSRTNFASSYIRLDNSSGIRAYYGINTSQDVEVNAADNTNLVFKTFGTERARFNTSGNLGIGTTNPITPLHVVGSGTTTLLVQGNARITGILTVGTSSLTLDGVNDIARIGTGVTITGSSGIVSATSYFASNARRVVAFDSGTTVTFHQAAAPTGWTKVTTHNDKALRVVSGAGGGSGGSTAFSSVMASRTPGGSVSGSNSGGSVNNTTLGLNEIPSHNHDGDGFETCRVRGSFGGGYQFGQPAGSTFFATYTNSRGGSGSHGHGFNNPSWSGSFTGTAMDFAVQYIDIILCSID